mmetsp:Transcript_36103/g.56389  ORF Transcript_36103/g.56389 Transcript_36103/m.56389 type:complete len:100 (-) Transcript_36103:245-544(-)
MVNFPKELKKHCKTCNKHTKFKVTQYKKGKDSLFAQGKRRYDRKQSGFGGQTKPVFHKKAKVNPTACFGSSSIAGAGTLETVSVQNLGCSVWQCARDLG